MRYLVLLCCTLFLWGCEYNYYYDTGDAGITDAIASEDDMAGIFTPDSKLQGQGTLALWGPPAAPAGALVPWPLIRDTPAISGAQTFLDLATKDNLPHVVTVSIGLTGNRPNTVFVPAYGEIVALLNLGIGGIPIIVEIDAIEGTVFSMPVNRLQMHMIYRAVPNSSAIPSPPATHDMGAAVATGTIAHGRQPQRTLTKSTNIVGPVPALIPAQTEAWIIPTFAKSFRVTAQPNNSQLQFTLVSILTGAPPPAIYNTVAYPSGDLPLVNGAYMLYVQNVGIANVNAYSMVFELAL